MIEFSTVVVLMIFGGLLAVAVLITDRCICRWHAKRPVPPPEPDTEPAEGDQWVLRGVAGAGPVTVRAVCAGTVFFAYEGAGTRSLLVNDFTRLYRSV